MKKIGSENVQFFLYVYASRELAVKFFDLTFLVPMGLGHMHIVVWHPNSCICTCPGPIRASNNNNPCTRIPVFIRCFFLCINLWFLYVQIFLHKHLFYIFMFLGLGGSRLIYVAVWHVSGCICICPSPIGTRNAKSKKLTASSLLVYTYKKLAHFPSRFFS